MSTSENVTVKEREIQEPHKFMAGLKLLGGALYLPNISGLTAGDDAQATATLCTHTINFFTTVAIGKAAKLPTASEGKVVIIVNDGANALKVWPNTDDTILGGSANAADPVTIPINEARIYVALAGDVDWRQISVGDIGA